MRREVPSLNEACHAYTSQISDLKKQQLGLDAASYDIAATHKRVSDQVRENKRHNAVLVLIVVMVVFVVVVVLVIS